MADGGSFKALPHGPIERLEENLWRVEGALPKTSLRRVMTVVRLPGGALLIHNAIAMEPPAMAELEAWGRPAWIVVPNGWHRLDAPRFKRRYPEAKVIAPRAALGRVSAVVPVDGDLDLFPSSDGVTVRHLGGTGGREGVVVARAGAGRATIVLNDIIFNMPHLPGIEGVVMRWLTASTGGPRISRVARIFLVKERAALREDLLRLAETPGLARIIVSHHEVIADDPAGTLRRVAETL